MSSERQQRRQQSRWTIAPVLLVFLGFFIGSGQSAPAGVSSAAEKTSTSASVPRRKSEQDIGSLSDFSWQAWLLVDTQAGIQPGVDSTALLRRITPKSVFIAPALPACAEGYRADPMGRCVKSVNIDENAHINFLLERLNALYANQDGATLQAATAKNDDKKSTGPLQLNIPLLIPADSNGQQSTEVEHHVPSPEKDNLTLAMPARDAYTRLDVRDRDDHRERAETPARATAYLHKDVTSNGTTLVETSSEKTTYLVGNSSANDVGQPGPTMVDAMVVAEFVDDTNVTSSFTDVVDYKIPLDSTTTTRAPLNASSGGQFFDDDDDDDASNVTRADVGDDVSTLEKRRDNSTRVSPTLVLLLSSQPPTKSPTNITRAFSSNNDDLATLALTRPSNATADRDRRITPVVEIARSSDNRVGLASNLTVAEEEDSPAKNRLQQPMTTTRDEDEHEEERVKSAVTASPSSRETEFLYEEDEEDEDDYAYGTDLPELEESTELEGEEILRHGETGMTFPSTTRNVERSHRPNETDRDSVTTTATTTTTTTTLGTSADRHVIRFNDDDDDDDDSTGPHAEDRHETASYVSSEVSIDDDLILETTLLDVSTESLPPKVTTSSPNARQRLSGSNLDEESLDESNPIYEAEVVFSQDAHVAPVQRTRTRTEQETSDEQAAAKAAAPLSSLSSLSSGDHSAPSATAEDNSTMELGAIDHEKRRWNGAKDERTSRPIPTAINGLDTTDEYADFPAFPPRFPFNEANSIHGPSYKQHSLYPSDELASYGNTSTKSSVPVRQKPVYYLATTSSWKPDRPQSDASDVPATSSERHKQNPTLLRFWSKMPLVRDPVDRIPDSETIDHARKQLRDPFVRTLRTIEDTADESEQSESKSASKSIDRFARKRVMPVDG